MTASPASGGAELREQPRPPGCLCLFLLETNAPPARPLPPARAGRPLPHQRGPGGYLRGSSPAALKLKGSRRAVGCASSPRLTSLRRPAVSPRALPGRRSHRGPGTALGPDWSTAAPSPPARNLPAEAAPAPATALANQATMVARERRGPQGGWARVGGSGGGVRTGGGGGGERANERAQSVSARGAGNFGGSASLGKMLQWGRPPPRSGLWHAVRGLRWAHSAAAEA
nr:translation initiation factor IF-2-like [Desmodus rotundus]